MINQLTLEVSELLYEILSTDQTYYLQQMADGTYKKKPGLLTPASIQKSINTSESTGAYQKNSNSTIKWLCFDFDVIKKHVGEESFDEAMNQLKVAVKYFCTSLDEFEIDYLLEFSGNRGFHVWITFSEHLNYSLGYDIVQTILENSGLKFDNNYIDIDLFPASKVPTGGVGKGVKLPLSKHKKTGTYSTLINGKNYLDVINSSSSLSVELLQSNIDILKSHKSISVKHIEESLGVFFRHYQDINENLVRIKRIKVQRSGFSLNSLFELWEESPPLKMLKNRITNNKNLSHEERKLIVGFFINLTARDNNNFNLDILHIVFSLTENYDKEKSTLAIHSLSSFYFPSQDQIETILKCRFTETLSIKDLIKKIIPNYLEHCEAKFDISNFDIGVTKRAEQNYIFQNDEAQSKKVLNELSIKDDHEFLIKITKIKDNDLPVNFYSHNRLEEDKTRKLITLAAPERVLTSCIVKQLIYFLDFPYSNNSFGYRVNKGFNGGYIFKPWLYQWIEFVSDISAALEDSANKDYYIVKADIKNFYDLIPHGNISRLLLGDANSNIYKKTSLLSESEKESYSSLVSCLLRVTSEIVSGSTGLPQGPAYARYLAELYLDNIDQHFDSMLATGQIFLYHRYVDDIFVICRTEEDANNIMEYLQKALDSISLPINEEKSSINKIANFQTKFDQYRSQSKYAVDKLSKNFDIATDTEKDLALTEFISLVQSDSCNDDLSFIFSHLSGITQTDEFKKEKVAPALNSGFGRGSLFRNIFMFVVENENNWDLLDDVKYFTELQSENLTSVLLNIPALNSESIRRFMQKNYSKLSLTKLVKEHLAYMEIVHEVNLGSNVEIDVYTILECIGISESPEQLNIKPETINKLTNNFSTVECLSEFTAYLYPLCINKNVSKESIAILSRIFFAKLYNDVSAKTLSINNHPAMLCEFSATRFYHLLCLFSLSDENRSEELLKAAWMYCVDLFNKTSFCTLSYKSYKWQEKLNLINIDNKKAQLVLAAIVEGSLHRGGVADERRIFEHFHNIIMIFVTSQKTLRDIKEINDELEKLSKITIFYKWLIEADDVTLFPKRSWFEANLSENDCTILRKGSKILFRKPEGAFNNPTSVLSNHNGYDEVIVGYDANNYSTVKDSLNGITVKNRLEKLIYLLKKNSDDDIGLPNIFSNERIIDRESLMPLSEELRGLNSLIFENEEGGLEIRKNTNKNFISLFFKIRSGDDNDEIINILSDKYINNFNAEVDLFEFICNMTSQLNDIGNIPDKFFYDIAIASALYLSLDDLNPLRKITTFVNQYERFNSDPSDRHIYCVNNSIAIEDSNATIFIDTIISSLDIVLEKIMPSLAFYLSNDIKNCKNELLKLISKLPNNEDFDLSNFKKTIAQISPLRGTIKLDGESYSNEQVFLLNITSNSIHQFSSEHTIVVSSCEHIFSFIKANTAYLIPFPSSISRLYLSIKERYDVFITKGGLDSSYPKLNNIPDLVNTPNYESALNVILIHKGVTKESAEITLKKWLISIPKRYHTPLINLIASHEVMSNNEISSFINKVKLLLASGKDNPMLIKRTGDFNGTHRLLNRETSIARQLDQIGPSSILNSVTRATIIVDNLISGTQIVKALKYYSLGTGNDDNYFDYSKNLKDEVSTKIKSLKYLDICCVLYTDIAIERIKDFFIDELNIKIIIKVVNGRDITNNAFFKSTNKISSKDKTEIIELFQDKDSLEDLCKNHLNMTSTTASSIIKESSDAVLETNLVTRYQSMPKKCFKILCAGLKHDPKCSPLERIPELNELKNGNN